MSFAQRQVTVFGLNINLEPSLAKRRLGFYGRKSRTFRKRGCPIKSPKKMGVIMWVFLFLSLCFLEKRGKEG